MNTNDTLYDFYRAFKSNRIISHDTLIVRTMSERTWGINNDRIRGNFISKLECLACERVDKTRQDLIIKCQAKFDDYGCPPPTTFDGNGQKLERMGS